jgi:DNA ligase D
MAEVRYATRTAEGRLRQASFLGLRQDRTWPPDVPKPVPRERSSRRRLVSDEDLAAIWVTTPDRVMFGPGGPTKLQLALYYASVGDWMLPELLQRPVSLVRCPTGEQASCFFQRHASPGMPPSVKSIALDGSAEEHAEYIFIDDTRGFLGLCQFGTVEFHPWGCRVDEPERPDRMIFDLDPDEDLRWRDVVDAGFHVREALAALGLQSFVKTTGGKGVHIIVPLLRQHTWGTVFRFSRAFVEELAASAPQRFTANMAKRSRRGRVFVDYHRNRRGATAVAAYSLRARSGAPASTPLSWQALREIDDPRDLDWSSVPKRLVEAYADPWQDMDAAAVCITRELETQVGIKPSGKT